MMRLLMLFVFVMVTACAPVEPGTLMRTVRKSEDMRATVLCLQYAERAAFPYAARQVCRRQSVLRQMRYAWEDCINEAEFECGRPPSMIDVVQAGY